MSKEQHVKIPTEPKKNEHTLSQLNALAAGTNISFAVGVNGSFSSGKKVHLLYTIQEHGKVFCCNALCSHYGTGKAREFPLLDVSHITCQKCLKELENPSFEQSIAARRILDSDVK